MTPALLSNHLTIISLVDFHYCPEFSERTAQKYLIYNDFSAILQVLSV